MCLTLSWIHLEAKNVLEIKWNVAVIYQELRMDEHIWWNDSRFNLNTNKHKTNCGELWNETWTVSLLSSTNWWHEQAEIIILELMNAISRKSINHNACTCIFNSVLRLIEWSISKNDACSPARQRNLVILYDKFCGNFTCKIMKMFCWLACYQWLKFLVCLICRDHCTCSASQNELENDLKTFDCIVEQWIFFGFCALFAMVTFVTKMSTLAKLISNFNFRT